MMNTTPILLDIPSVLTRAMDYNVHLKAFNTRAESLYVRMFEYSDQPDAVNEKLIPAFNACRDTFIANSLDYTERELVVDLIDALIPDEGHRAELKTGVEQACYVATWVGSSGKAFNESVAEYVKPV